MPGKQANEQGFRRAPGKGFQNCYQRGIKNNRKSSNRFGSWNQGKGIGNKSRHRGCKSDPGTGGQQPETKNKGV